jgi:hypothetical protein
MKKIIVLLFLSLTLGIKSQTKIPTNLTHYWDSVSPVKKAMFTPYVRLKHWDEKNYSDWQKPHKPQFIKEFWYFAESFYIKRNVFERGTTLDESIIDISRFEHLRKENVEFEYHIPIFKDVIVLLPKNKLLYKP